MSSVPRPELDGQEDYGYTDAELHPYTTTETDTTTVRGSQNSTSQGSQQAIGNQGSDGYLQPVGTQGSDGYLQPVGTQGSDGYLQPVGTQGSDGYLQPVGTQGSDGYLEPVGTQGSDGYLEPVGTQGSDGYLQPVGTEIEPRSPTSCPVPYDNNFGPTSNEPQVSSTNPTHLDSQSEQPYSSNWSQISSIYPSRYESRSNRSSDPEYADTENGPQSPAVLLGEGQTLAYAEPYSFGSPGESESVYEEIPEWWPRPVDFHLIVWVCQQTNFGFCWSVHHHTACQWHQPCCVWIFCLSFVAGAFFSKKEQKTLHL